MKKIIFIMIAMLSMAIGINAQTQTNYAGSSKFTDNWSVSLQGGVLTTMNDFFTGNTAMAPTVVLGADKYLNPWFGVGVDARALIGTGEVGVSKFNSHTALDALNISGYVKFNILNMINGLNSVGYDGTRKFFEPVVYTGLGWGHQFCGCVTNTNDGTHTDGVRNYLTYRAGAEFNFNLGKEKAWAIVVNPSVVWGRICNGMLDKRQGNFEITAGVVYHFKTSNGTRTFTKARLYDQAEVDALNAKIAELQNRPVKVVEKVVPATNATATVKTDATYAVNFAQNSAELTDAAKAVLDKVPAGATVKVAGATSPEGKASRNVTLASERATAVAKYLESRNVKVSAVEGGAAGRVAVVTVTE